MASDYEDILVLVTEAEMQGEEVLFRFKTGEELSRRDTRGRPYRLPWGMKFPVTISNKGVVIREPHAMMYALKDLLEVLKNLDEIGRCVLASEEKHGQLHLGRDPSGCREARALEHSKTLRHSWISSA